MRSNPVALSRWIGTGIPVLVILLGLVVSGTAQDATNPARMASPLDEIADLRQRSMDENLSIEVRSNALDQCLELREKMIAEGRVRGDLELASWHADQAADLLLRRVEFPNSWSTHLFNADPTCPLLPAEIPLLIARGIEQAGLAEALVKSAIEEIQSRPENDQEDLDLLERLRFEQELRIPLLESIGLILASNIDQGASIDALERLDRISEEVVERNQVRSIVDSWKIQAALASKDRERLSELLASANLDPSELDRIRIAAVLEGPDHARKMAAAAFEGSDEQRVYERMLFADLHARYLSESLKHSDSPEPGKWNDGTATLWLRLLEEDHQTREVIDAAIAARLVGRTDAQGDAGMPLAAAWAVGRAELARRSQGEIGNPSVTERLRKGVRENQASALVRARALDMLFRLLLQEGERLEAARIGGILFREHPDFPNANPELVADLVEPWAVRGDPDAATLYEDALTHLIENESTVHDRAAIRRNQADRIRLAEHLVRTERPKEGCLIVLSVDPQTESIACDLLEVRSNCLEALGRVDELGPEALIDLQDQLEKDGRGYLARFSNNGTTPVSSNLLRVFHGSKLASVRSNLRRGYRAEDLEKTTQIIDRIDLDRQLRIEALFLRHQIRLLNSETREAAIETAPDIGYAIGLDLELAMRRLVAELEATIERVHEARDAGRKADAVQLCRERLRAVTRLITPEDVMHLTFQERMIVAEAQTLSGWQDKSIILWESLAGEQPNAWAVLEGRADALFLSEKEAELGEAIQLYRRLGQGAPDQFVPAATWWNAQRGQLLVLEKVGRSLERIAPRIQRLRLQDPELGGLRFKKSFDTLQERVLDRENESTD